MFKVRNWISVSALQSQIYADMYFWRDLIHASSDDKLARAEANRISWRLIDDASRIALLTSSGAIVELEPAFIASTFDNDGPWGYYTHLTVGTLGSGNFLSDERTTPSPRDWVQERFGPFSYCPIFVSEKDTAEKLAQITTSERRHSSKDYAAYKDEPQLGDEILKMYESGERLRKPDFKRLLAPDLKHEAFNAAWREAALKVPELSRSGPKATRND